MRLPQSYFDSFCTRVIIVPSSIYFKSSLVNFITMNDFVKQNFHTHVHYFQNKRCSVLIVMKKKIYFKRLLQSSNRFLQYCMLSIVSYNMSKMFKKYNYLLQYHLLQYSFLFLLIFKNNHVFGIIVIPFS